MANTITVGTKLSYDQRDKLRLTAHEKGYRNIAEFLKALVMREIGGEDSEVNSSLTEK